MHVSDNAYVLSAKPHGERGYVVTVFGEQGLRKGLWRGSRKNAGSLLNPLNLVEVSHTRRLENQLGNFTLELQTDYASRWLAMNRKLAALNYLSEILRVTLPAEHAYPPLFHRLSTLLSTDLSTEIDEDFWPSLLRFEYQLLTVLGVGLSLHEEDAVRGEGGDDSPLTHVSPRSGRAVSEMMAAPHASKLLLLPHCFGGPYCEDERADILQAWQVLGHFLNQLTDVKKLTARQRLIELV